MRRLVLLTAVGVLLITLGQPAAGIAKTKLDFRLVTKVESPTALTSHPSSPERLLVTERRGRVRVIERGRLRPRPMLDLRGRVNSTWVEQGLLGIALPPDHKRTRRFYIMFTRSDGDLLVEEWKTRARRPNLADPSSRRRVIRIPRVAEKGNHNGGVLRFRGRNLFITVGDGNDPGDYLNRAQDPYSLRGKVLRIDPRRNAALGKPYRIPAGNPFADGSGRPEVFATGLRNPHALFFHRRPGKPAEVTIYDVGQLRFEEVNHLQLRSLRGANFGWNVWEGRERYDCDVKCPNGTEGTQTASPVTWPVHVYEHTPSKCAVIGGPVVRDRSLRGLTGRLIFGDFCSPVFSSALPSIEKLDPVRSIAVKLPISGFPAINAINEDARGRIYVLSNRGQVLALRKAR
jgi:glucose/arabinose dehydrogenase